MSPQERALFDALGKERKMRLPEEWARIAWPTAFVCKRSGKPKAHQSVLNAERKAKEILELFVEKGLAFKEWAFIEAKAARRVVYWRNHETVPGQG